MRSFDSLCKSINYKFKNTSLLKIALTHPSMRLNNSDIIDNQRLEFLGDAVLELAVSRYLYDKYPDRDEGWLTNMRIKMVCRDALVALANSIDLGKYLIMSQSMLAMNGANNEHNLEDAFEALLAAIYLDSDLENLTNILFNIYKKTPNILNETKPNNKGNLQEFLQSKKLGLPEYRLLNYSGPAHDRIFEIALYIGDKEISRAKASSKKAAEQLAAKYAMNLLEKENMDEA